MINNKIQYSYDEIETNISTICRKIKSDKFIPNMIIPILKGGALLGNLVYRYFKEYNSDLQYEAAIIQSYDDNDQTNDNIKGIKRFDFTGTYILPTTIKKHDILIVDDVYDTGQTIDILYNYLHTNNKLNIKILTHDYKLRESSIYNTLPDYYCRITSPDTWIEYPWE